MKEYDIDENIAHANTLPGAFYQDPETWEIVKEKIFAKTWLYLADPQNLFRGPENAVPVTLLENYLHEPILLVESEDALQCLSNVCTHRGFLLMQHPKQCKKLVCGYHGRRFDLRGQFEFMPEFEAAENFPSACDHLSHVPFARWRQFGFAGINPAFDFSIITERLEERLYFLPIESFRFAPEYSKTYSVHAHWALYCDNYLEGFHIPFVHQSLGAILDYGKYTTECYDQIVLQIGYSDGTGYCFDLPEGHPDFGQDVTAYYYWIFPNLMLNLYPWGVQLNIIRPVSTTFTKVEFLYYIYDQEIFETMDGNRLAEKTEREDEFVVEAVQKGLQSHFYQAGRFSPKREKGVHYFHRLIAEHLKA
ncbi:MAG: Rieske 2Fe-2S domain-containing protein [Saprospiraceae bacterium]|nr:Rieske 2Fe-2S domain-containing protein [Saprospiraceae bacterium]